MHINNVATDRNFCLSLLPHLMHVSMHDEQSRTQWCLCSVLTAATMSHMTIHSSRDMCWLFWWSRTISSISCSTPYLHRYSNTAQHSKATSH